MIWIAGIGAILAVFSLFLMAGFNHNAYYPSVFDLQDSQWEVVLKQFNKRNSG
jgi:hypothetical protein